MCFDGAVLSQFAFAVSIRLQFAALLRTVLQKTSRHTFFAGIISSWVVRRSADQKSIAISDSENV